VITTSQVPFIFFQENIIELSSTMTGM